METLCDIPLFSALDETLGEQYGKSCLWKEYGENELVIDEDDDTKDLRCVISGRVRIINRIAIGKEVILGEMKDGDSLEKLQPLMTKPVQPPSQL